MEEVTPKWRELGIALGFSTVELDTIEQECFHKTASRNCLGSGLYRNRVIRGMDLLKAYCRADMPRNVVRTLDRDSGSSASSWAIEWNWWTIPEVTNTINSKWNRSDRLQPGAWGYSLCCIILRSHLRQVTLPSTWTTKSGSLTLRRHWLRAAYVYVSLSLYTDDHYSGIVKYNSCSLTRLIFKACISLDSAFRTYLVLFQPCIVQCTEFNWKVLNAYYTPQSLRECIVFGRCVCLSVDLSVDLSVCPSVRIFLSSLAFELLRKQKHYIFYVA